MLEEPRDEIEQRARGLPVGGRDQHGVLVGAHEPVPLGGRDEIRLVVDEDARDVVELELREHLLRRLHLLVARGVRGVDDVEQEIGVGGFLERGAERREEILRQIADEPHGVGEDDLALLRKS
jgi:hypothetical protein